ncbi:MAG: T9SS type A sorting domain-containing protein [Bacteroidetes bacterium]|nr:T9SS type A sorting domain-containing protein [Bacteroidota bacterium]
MNKLFIVLFFFVNQIVFAQITNPSPYCDASFDDMQGFPVDDHINSVSFGTLNNVTSSQFAAPHYVFYNNLSVANFTRGNAYTLTVNFTTAGGCGYGVWIDYNHNNTFETSEKIAGTTGTSMLTVGATPTITQSVTIPVTAVTGNTRMRIRIVEDDNYNMTTTSELPCNASSSATDVMDWGETEDYTINISSSTGLNEIANEANFDLFPNPSTGIFTIKAGNVDIETIEIYSVLGNIIYKKAFIGSQSIIDLSNLPKGIYFVAVKNSLNAVTTKMITIQ